MTIRDIAIAFGFDIDKNAESKVNATVSTLKNVANHALNKIEVGFESNEATIQQAVESVNVIKDEALAIAENAVAFVVDNTSEQFASESIEKLKEEAKPLKDNPVAYNVDKESEKAATGSMKRLRATAKKLLGVIGIGFSLVSLAGAAREFISTNDEIQERISEVKNEWNNFKKNIDETFGVSQKFTRVMVRGLNQGMKILSKLQDGFTRLSKRVGGADKLLRLMAISAGAIFLALNAKKIMSFVSGLGKGLGMINAKMLLIIAVVVLLALLIDDFINFMQGNDSLLGELLKKAGVDIEAVRATIFKAWDSIKAFLKATWQFIKNLATAIWGGLKKFWSTHGDDVKKALLAAWDAIKARLVALWEGIKAIAIAVFNALKAFWYRWGDTIMAVFSVIFGFLSKSFSNFLKVLTSLFGVFASVFRGDWKGAWEGVKNIFSAHWNQIKNIFDTILKVVMTILGGFFGWSESETEGWVSKVKGWFQKGVDFVRVIFDALKAFWDKWGSTITQFFTMLFEGIKNYIIFVFNMIKTAIEFAINIISTIIKFVFNGIKAFWDAWGDTIVKTFVTMWELIKNAFQTAVDIIMGIVTFFIKLFKGDWEGAWEAIKGVFISAWDGIKNAFKLIIDWILSTFSELPGKMLEFGKNMIKGFIDGIKNMAGAVKDAVGGVIGNVKNFLGFNSPAKEGEGKHIVEWGYNMVDGFLDGVKKAKPLIDGIMNGAVGEISADLAMLANSGTASQTTTDSSSTSNTTTVIQNVEISNKFEGDRAGQKKSSEAMDKASDDAFGRLARALAFVRG